MGCWKKKKCCTRTEIMNWTNERVNMNQWCPATPTHLVFPPLGWLGNERRLAFKNHPCGESAALQFFWRRDCPLYYYEQRVTNVFVVVTLLLLLFLALRTPSSVNNNTMNAVHKQHSDRGIIYVLTTYFQYKNTLIGHPPVGWSGTLAGLCQTFHFVNHLSIYVCMMNE